MIDFLIFIEQKVIFISYFIQIRLNFDGHKWFYVIFSLMTILLDWLSNLLNSKHIRRLCIIFFIFFHYLFELIFIFCVLFWSTCIFIILICNFLISHKISCTYFIFNTIKISIINKSTFFMDRSKIISIWW